MKRNIFTLRNLSGALLTALLGLLGFSSCHTNKAAKGTPEKIDRIDREETIIAMYGTPTSRYQIKEVEVTPVDSADSQNAPADTVEH